MAVAAGAPSGVVTRQPNARRPSTRFAALSGSITEATISNVLVPPGAPIRRAIGVVLAETGADYAIAGARDVRASDGFLPLRVLGPVMTWNALARPSDPSFVGAVMYGQAGFLDTGLTGAPVVTHGLRVTVGSK